MNPARGDREADDSVIPVTTFFRHSQVLEFLMVIASTKPMSAEEFLEWISRSENSGKRFELESGEVIEMPSPSELHGFVCWLAGMILGNYLLRRGSGYICSNDTGLIVRRNPDIVRGPDIMVFLENRTIEQMNRRFCDRVPAMIVEVLSPTDSMLQTTRRVSQYLDYGVALVWVIDPQSRVVYVHRNDEYTKVLDESEELNGNGVLPDFRCRVAELFALPTTTPELPPGSV